MTTAKLHQLHTVQDVARACGLDSSTVNEYAETTDQASLYWILRIPKRGRGRAGNHRIVYSAKSGVLSGFHRSISMLIVNSVVFGNHVQGFVKKRSTYTNAERHLGAEILLHADITNFFDSITVDQVWAAFISAGSPPDLAHVLAKACTIDGYLRQGTRCAPAIANLVCQHLDLDMLALAAGPKASYTRYADDLTFSGSMVPHTDSVRSILQKYGFDLRGGKCITQTRGRNQYVTGLTIADKTQPRLPRSLKRRLRLEMYYIQKFGIDGHVANLDLDDFGMGLSGLEGMLRYVNSIEPHLAFKWKTMLIAGIEKSNDSRRRIDS